jgi:cytochrome c oxidase subunit 2
VSAALPGGHASEAIAVAAERRWAIVVLAITGLIVLVMIVTGLHWASMPPSRVETVDVRTLHLKGEFVESNLGTLLEPDGKVTVRLVAQQYSFVPQCIVVPEGQPVVFRATATDTITASSSAGPTRTRCSSRASSRPSPRRSRRPASS